MRKQLACCFTSLSAFGFADDQSPLGQISVGSTVTFLKDIVLPVGDGLVYVQDGSISRNSEVNRGQNYCYLGSLTNSNDSLDREMVAKAGKSFPVTSVRSSGTVYIHLTTPSTNKIAIVCNDMTIGEFRTEMQGILTLTLAEPIEL